MIFPSRILNKLTSGQISGLIVGLVVLSGALGYAISQANNVEITTEGIKIQKQAIVVQKDLEKSLLLNQIQQQTIEQLLSETSDFSKKYKAGEQLLQEQQKTSSVVPDKEIEELEETVKKSKELLQEEN